MMFVRRIAVLAVAAASICASICASVAAEKKSYAAEDFPQPYGARTWKPIFTDEYKKLVAEGTQALKSGDIDAGITALMRASKLQLGGEPGLANYELWDDIGAAQCKRSEGRLAGQWMLAAYRCAVKLMGTPTQCYTGQGPNIVPNADMPPLCFREFCGDPREPGWMNYGPSDGDEQIWDHDFGEDELKRVDALIKQCRAPARPASRKP